MKPQRQETANSDMLTWIVMFKRETERTLHDECNLTLTQYRVLAKLSDDATQWRVSTLAKQLRLSDAMVSKTVKSLVDQGFVMRIPASGKRGSLSLSERGNAALTLADLSIEAMQRDFFSPLGKDLFEFVTTGSQLTNISAGSRGRVQGKAFLGPYGNVEGFLLSEYLSNNSAHLCGLQLPQARVLLFIWERMKNGSNGCSPSSISKHLILAPPTVSELLQALYENGFVERKESPFDKRSHQYALTQAGDEKIQAFSTQMHRALANDIRPSGTEERTRYDDAAALVVSSLMRRQLLGGA